LNLSISAKFSGSPKVCTTADRCFLDRTKHDFYLSSSISSSPSSLSESSADSTFCFLINLDLFFRLEFSSYSA
uniref:Uncharacterized protein n=1 Tax=Ciona savignyi TaxID=51511 RepID=H2Z7W7_CIOSA